MISEKNFAKEYPSFWEEHTPWLKDFYATEASLGRRMSKSIDIPEEGIHVYVNNIIATTHFRNRSSDPDCSFEKSFEDSIPLIDSFSKKRREEYRLSEDYKKIIDIQAKRLESIYRGSMIHDPDFPGCGIMTNCRGDLLWGTTLVEIKANRDSANRTPFRPEDFRQLLIYCALNYLAGDIYDIQSIQLFNPRRGFLWEAELEPFVYEISDSTGADLFEQIGHYLTDKSEFIDLGIGFPDNI